MKDELPKSVQCGDVLAAVQLCPFGEWPNGRTVQTCDEAAFNKLVENWRESGGREVICDFEHRYEDPSLTSDTSAAAWITNLAVNKERGLVGDLKFTDAGAAAVTSRRLRFLSPVWELDASGRPSRLRSVALTNKPNIPVACVLNRAPRPDVQTVEDAKEKQMERLKELLGLAADASDEDVVAAVTALQEQVAQANKDKEEAEAESFAEEHKAVCNKDALKKAYLLNKEAARGIEQAVDGLYSEYGVTTDEGSGLPVTSFVHGTPSRNKRFMNVACMMGAKLTRETSPANNKAPGYIQLVTA